MDFQVEDVDCLPQRSSYFIKSTPKLSSKQLKRKMLLLPLFGLFPEDIIGNLTKLQVLDLSVHRTTGFSSDFWVLSSSLVRLNFVRNLINGSFQITLGTLCSCKALIFQANDSPVRFLIPVPVGLLPSLKVRNPSGSGSKGRMLDRILECKSLISNNLNAENLRILDL